MSARLGCILLAVALASCAAPPAPPPPRAPPAEAASIALTHIRQENNLCVPTSAAMVLAYYGDPHPPRELKVWSRGRDYSASEPFDDFTITFFNPLVAAMHARGYRWAIRAYANDDTGFEQGMRDIAASLDGGRPVLVDTTMYGGHTMPVTGYEGKRRQVTLIDPNVAAPGVLKLDYERFARIWNSSGAGSRLRGAIFTAPKPR